MDNNDDLVEYIAQQIRQGVPGRTVRESLARHGWSNQQIDDGFARNRERESLNLPMPLPKEAARKKAGKQLPSLPSTEYPPIEYRTEQGTSRPSSALRLALTVLLAACLFVVLLAGGQSFLGKYNSTTPPDGSYDEQRKHELDSLASKLETYKDARGYYPTPQALNDVRFKMTADGFDAKSFRDPEWRKDNSVCSDNGTPVFSSSRAHGCYSYRVSAANGDECDDRLAACVSAFVTAELSNGKPYILLLDDTGSETR